MAEYSVARASLREAMRILETEGLITILRGSKGGAVVRTPKAANAAYTLGLVLSVQRRSSSSQFDDVPHLVIASCIAAKPGSRFHCRANNPRPEPYVLRDRV